METLPTPALSEAKPAFRMVRVLNRNPFLITDRWDGVPYCFRPGETLSIPPEAAAHFFAWPADPEIRRMHIAKRMGWNTPDDIKRDPATGRMRWEEWVDKIEVTTVDFDLVARSPDAPIPALSDDDNVLAEGDEDVPRPLSPQPDLTATRAGRGRSNVGRRGPKRIEV